MTQNANLLYKMTQNVHFWSPFLDIGISYNGFNLKDTIDSNFDVSYQTELLKAVDLLDKLSPDEAKKILVTCFAGVSRSATTVICYLIQKKNMTAYEALTQVRTHRDVNPSHQQLIYVAKLHNKKFGYDNVEVIDEEFPLTEFRKMVIQVYGK